MSNSKEEATQFSDDLKTSVKVENFVVDLFKSLGHKAKRFEEKKEYDIACITNQGKKLKFEIKLSRPKGDGTAWDCFTPEYESRIENYWKQAQHIIDPQTANYMVHVDPFRKELFFYKYDKLSAFVLDQVEKGQVYLMGKHKTSRCVFMPVKSKEAGFAGTLPFGDLELKL
jgi:hypothetical protein